MKHWRSEALPFNRARKPLRCGCPAYNFHTCISLDWQFVCFHFTPWFALTGSWGFWRWQAGDLWLRWSSRESGRGGALHAVIVWMIFCDWNTCLQVVGNVLRAWQLYRQDNDHHLCRYFLMKFRSFFVLLPLAIWRESQPWPPWWGSRTLQRIREPLTARQGSWLN